MEMYNISQKIKLLSREKDILAGDSENRVKLSMKKSDLENFKKKLKKITEGHGEEDAFIKKQRLKTTESIEQVKKLGAQLSADESTFEQLDKDRTVYEEYVKISKETIPQAETKLSELKVELNLKTQALDDIV